MSCFNPRAREGRDLVGCFISHTLFVSIRAPARGATLIHTKVETIIDVSIRAPARGATAKS